MFMPGTLKSRIKADGGSSAPALFQALATQGRETIFMLMFWIMHPALMKSGLQVP